MNRLSTSDGHLVTKALRGHAGTAAGIPAPYLVLDLGRGVDPHQARCRRCRWRSRWRATAPQVRAEYDRHRVAAHGPGRRAGLRGRLGRVARERGR
jgi:hypothetical protein